MKDKLPALGDRGRILPRYSDTAIETDPFARRQAEREAREAKAKADIAKGHTPDADPADLRGIPVIARGVGGTSPHTNPLTEVIERERISELRKH